MCAEFDRHADDPGIIGRHVVGGNDVEEPLRGRGESERTLKRIAAFATGGQHGLVAKWVKGQPVKVSVFATQLLPDRGAERRVERLKTFHPS